MKSLVINTVPLKPLYTFSASDACRQVRHFFSSNFDAIGRLNIIAEAIFCQGRIPHLHAYIRDVAANGDATFPGEIDDYECYHSQQYESRRALDYEYWMRYGEIYNITQGCRPRVIIFIIECWRFPFYFCRFPISCQYWLSSVIWDRVAHRVQMPFYIS